MVCSRGDLFVVAVRRGLRADSFSGESSLAPRSWLDEKRKDCFQRGFPVSFGAASDVHRFARCLEVPAFPKEKSKFAKGGRSPAFARLGMSGHGRTAPTRWEGRDIFMKGQHLRGSGMSAGLSSGKVLSSPTGRELTTILREVGGLHKKTFRCKVTQPNEAS